MKRSFLLLFLPCLFLFGCAQKEKTLKIAATPVPHTELLEFIKPELEENGFDLKIIEIDDYNLPNRLLEERQVDANFFQHVPFLEEYNRIHHTHLVPLTAVHIEPMGLYSRKIQSLDDVRKGAVVAIPSDPTNGARALQLLAQAGLVKLGSTSQLSTPRDIIENPKNIRVEEIDAPFLPRALPDVDLAAIPANFALQAKLQPKTDALILESTDSPYANVVVVRLESLSRADLAILKKVLNSEKMRKHINETYRGAIIPAF